MLNKRINLFLITMAGVAFACLISGSGLIGTRPVQAIARGSDVNQQAVKSTIAVNSAVVQDKALVDILKEKGIDTERPGLRIIVDKSEHILSLFKGDTWLKSYHVELGDNGLGDKEISGDHKTPEGTLYITEKSVLSPADQYLGTRWMRLSYPDIEDANRGIQNGIINQQTYEDIVEAVNNISTPPQETALGGGVGIHGGSTPKLGSDWTWGCVGLNNKDVEDLYDFVKVGTQVIIQK